MIPIQEEFMHGTWLRRLGNSLSLIFLLSCGSIIAATTGDRVTYLGTTTNASIDITRSQFYWEPSTNCRFQLSGSLAATNRVNAILLTINASSGFLVTNVVDTLSARTIWGQLRTGLNNILLRYNGAQWEVAEDPTARDLSFDLGIPPDQEIVNDSLDVRITELETDISSLAAIAYQPNFISVSNTVTETAIFTNTIPANILGSSGVAKLDLYGNFLNNTGGASNFTVKVYLGTGNVVYQDTTFLYTSSSARRPTRIQLAVQNLTSSSQFISLAYNVGAQAVPTVGVGDLSVSGGGQTWLVYGTASEDSTADIPVSITITPQEAASTLVWDKYWAIFYRQ